MAIKKVLIANRGEIALRIIRACHRLGYGTVGVYSKEDRDQMHLRFADQTVCIGPAAPQESYLNIPQILAAAQITDADAIHPGYGFLAENATFAHRVAEQGLTFIGPSGHHIELMGDKASARKFMASNGVPIVPGTETILVSVAEAKEVAAEIGYPIMLKATAGGGGRGTRIVWAAEEMEENFNSASNESQHAFSNSDLYIEKYLEKPRHIEVQLICDGETALHFGERDCSVQRRRQKVIEEGPALNVDQAAIETFRKACVHACQKMKYKGLGTIEALYEKGQLYFMEMNTRVQVEHPVTEMITQQDLIGLQLSVAAGEKLTLSQEDIVINGHCIECRINAEDPKTFVPSPGTIDFVHPPSGPWVRFDSHIYAGCTIPRYYDSLTAKVIVWDMNRELAINRMLVALDELTIEGIVTNKQLHIDVLNDERFRKEPVHINFLEKEFLGTTD